MLFDFRDGVFVGVHTAEAPSSEEWRRLCSDIERERLTTRGVLVFTLGGAPSTQQRQEMRAAIGDIAVPPCAILTASPLVRGIITSLNWFLGNQVKAFDPNDIERALRYVASGKAAIDPVQIVETLSQLASKLSVELPISRGAVAS